MRAIAALVFVGAAVLVSVTAITAYAEWTPRAQAVDIGRVSAYESRDKQVRAVLQNGSRSRIELKDPISSCGCLRAELVGPRILEPGQSVDLVCVLNVPGRPGRFQHEVRVPIQGTSESYHVRFRGIVDDTISVHAPWRVFTAPNLNFELSVRVHVPGHIKQDPALGIDLGNAAILDSEWTTESDGNRSANYRLAGTARSEEPELLVLAVTVDGATRLRQVVRIEPCQNILAGSSRFAPLDCEAHRFALNRRMSPNATVRVNGTEWTDWSRSADSLEIRQVSAEPGSVTRVQVYDGGSLVGFARIHRTGRTR